MKHKLRAFAALLFALVLLVLAAPPARALESAPFAVMQGTPTLFELYGKFKNDGSTDYSTRYSDFASVTVDDPGIAEVFKRGDKWFAVGRATDESTSFTATLQNGETVTGTINSFQKWDSPKGPGYPYVGISPSMYYIPLGASFNFSIVGTGKAAGDYAWSAEKSTGTISDGKFIANASKEGLVKVTAREKSSGVEYYAWASVYDRTKPLFLEDLPYLSTRMGSRAIVWPPYPASGWFGPKSGLWSVGDTRIACISYNWDGSFTVYPVGSGKTTYTFTDAATGVSKANTIYVY